MTEKKIPPLDRTELRRRAEEQLGEKTGTMHPPATVAESLRLHHELQVHQIELEMQNAELCQAQVKLETALEKYTDLYAAAGSYASKATTIAPEGERMPRLLLAEDDLVIQQLVGIVLKRSNYQLDIAEDGLMATEMWEKGDYDLVLMDIQMPRLNGFDATRIIREKERGSGRHIPIIAMTAHARKEDEESCLAAGMDGYISKPINIPKILQLIGDLLKQKP